MSDWRIPFNRVDILGAELDYVRYAIENGHLSGDGPFTAQCERLLEDLLPDARVLLTTSCTHALELAGLLLEVGPRTEIVVPSFTFTSTANAFVLHGARIVFCDIRPDTLNLDENQLASLISEHTRAVVPVHYAGVACELDSIGALATAHGFSVVEDNAHGLFGSFHDQPLGTFGSLATLSFHETKNVTAGEGGALVINDEKLLERAEVLREKGTDRKRFFRGEVDKYTWHDIGSSYIPSELNAAFLLAQLEKHELIQRRRSELWHAYEAGLRAWASATGVDLPNVPAECGQAFHLFYLILPSREARDGLIAHLRQQGILAVFHYQPLHTSPMGRRLGGREGDCPVAERLAPRLVRLPLFTGLTDDEQASVIQSVSEFHVTNV
jgi:dTDP-4-amino-4,6-dideoxygalactose transaminase